VRTSVGTLLSELVSSTQRLSRIAVREAGDTTSAATWRTLDALQTASPQRLGELASLTRVSQPTITGLVGTLTERGWVERVTDPSDARAQLIEITPSGLAAIEEWRDRAAAAMEPYFDELDDAEYDVLQRAVDLLSKRTARAELARR
jgi:DNA-binding MarR family transcriptional regulator